MAKTAEDILREAAQAAKQIIPEIERQAEAQQRALAATQAKLANLRAIAATSSDRMGYYGVGQPTITATTTAVTSGGGTFTFGNANVPVADKVTIVLQSENRPLTTREMATGLEKRFGESVPMSTLYAALSKWRDKRFIEEDGKWTIKKSEGQR